MKTIYLSMLLLLFTLTAFSQGRMAPDFVLPDLDGQNYQLSEQIGKGPVFINFWATWCIPCRSEMKKLKKIYKKYHKQGVTFLAISIDDPKTMGKVKSFVNTNRYPFKVLLDTNNDVFKLYQGTNPPLSILIDNDGQIVYTHTGYRKGDEKKVEQKIAELLNEE